MIFVASIITLVITQTRGVYASFLIGFALLLFFARRHRLLALGGIVAATAGSLILAFTHVGEKMQEFLLRGETTQSANGLSGRLELWEISIKKILEQLWTGYGGFAGSRFVVMPLAENKIASSVLNVYLDAMLNIGIWGLLLLLPLLGLIAWQFLRLIYRSSAPQSTSLATSSSPSSPRAARPKRP